MVAQLVINLDRHETDLFQSDEEVSHVFRTASGFVFPMVNSAEYRDDNLQVDAPHFMTPTKFVKWDASSKSNVISSNFHTRQYRDDDHQGDAPHFRSKCSQIKFILR